MGTHRECSVDLYISISDQESSTNAIAINITEEPRPAE